MILNVDHVTSQLTKLLVDVVASDYFPRIATASSSVRSTVFLSGSSEIEALDDDDLCDVVEQSHDSPFVDIEVMVHQSHTSNDRIRNFSRSLPNSAPLTPLSEVVENRNDVTMSLTDTSLQNQLKFGPLPTKRYPPFKVGKPLEKGTPYITIERKLNSTCDEVVPLKAMNEQVQSTVASASSSQTNTSSFITNIFSYSKQKEKGLKSSRLEIGGKNPIMSQDHTKMSASVNQPRVNRHSYDNEENNDGVESITELSTDTETPTNSCITM